MMFPVDEISQLSPENQNRIIDFIRHFTFQIKRTFYGLLAPALPSCLRRQRRRGGEEDLGCNSMQPK